LIKGWRGFVKKPRYAMAGPELNYQVAGGGFRTLAAEGSVERLPQAGCNMCTDRELVGWSKQRVRCAVPCSLPTLALAMT